MKILLAANFTTQSAYAFQARAFVPFMQALGHDVLVMDIRGGVGGATAQIGDVTVLPTALDAVGNDILPGHFQRSQADVVLTLTDTWAFQPDVMKLVPWYPFVPVDHQPAPPAVAHALTAARGALALTRFGQTELRRLGIDALYVPHGVDPAVWYPAVTSTDCAAARSSLRPFPSNAFIVSFVGVNDSNPSRKGIPELLAAWALWQPKHPDALLYLHTTRLGNLPITGVHGGVDIDRIQETFEIQKDSVILPDEYRLRTGIPAEELATIARASDVFILPSRGEGFGVPLIEFQHAGCPVITTDFGGGAELCASGWKIEYELGWSWQHATYANPGIASILDQLDAAYAERGNVERRRQAAAFARDYEFDYVATKYIAPALETIAEATILAQGKAA